MYTPGMETEARPKKKMGRPSKPPEERSLTRTFKVPPDLWREVETYVPRGERSAAIQEALRRTVARYKRRRQDEAAALDEQGYRECSEEASEFARAVAPAFAKVLEESGDRW